MRYLIKLKETESKIVITSGWGGGGRECCLMDVELQICKVKKFWRSVCQQFGYTQYY